MDDFLEQVGKRMGELASADKPYTRRDSNGEPICYYCGGSFVGVRVEIEHVVPRARGGTNHASNLVLACVRCNGAKKDWHPLHMPRDGWPESLVIDYVARIMMRPVEATSKSMPQSYSRDLGVMRLVPGSCRVDSDVLEKIDAMPGGRTENIRAAIRWFVELPEEERKRIVREAVIEERRRAIERSRHRA